MENESKENENPQECKITCPACEQHLVLENPELFDSLNCPGCDLDISDQLPKKETSSTTNNKKLEFETANLSLLDDCASTSEDNAECIEISEELINTENPTLVENIAQKEVQQTSTIESSKKSKEVSNPTSKNQELSLICDFCNQKLIIEKPDQFEQIICPGCQVDISDQKPTKIISSKLKPITRPEAGQQSSQKLKPIKVELQADKDDNSKKEKPLKEKGGKDSIEKKNTKKPKVRVKSKAKNISVSQTTVKKIKTKKVKKERGFAFILCVCAIILAALMYKSKELRQYFEPPRAQLKEGKPLKEKKKKIEPPPTEAIKVEEIKTQALIVSLPKELPPLDLIDEMKVPESALLNKTEIKTLIGKLKTHCYDCHGNEVHEEDLNFEVLNGAEDYYKKYNIFKQSLAFIRASEMPPPEDKELDTEEKEEFAELVQKLLFTIETRSRKVSQKPKIQRLNSKNYNTTVKAVTGLDLDLSKKFQIDNTNDISIVSFEKFLGAAEFISRYSAYNLEQGFIFNEKPVLKQPRAVLIKGLKTQQYQYLPKYYFKDFKQEVALRRSMLALADFLRSGGKSMDQLKAFAKKRKISPVFVQQTSAFIKKYSLDTSISKGLKDWKRLSIKKYPEEQVNEAIDSFITHWQESLNELETNQKINNLKRRQIQKFDQLISAIFVLPKELIMIELSEVNLPKYQQLEGLINFIEHKNLSPQLTQLMKAQSREFLDKLLRRPAEDSEVNSFLNSFLQLTYEHGSDNAVQLMITQSFLRTEFLFRFEKKTPQFKKLSAFELANRLSYLIWNQPPDQALYELASSGQIFDRQVLIDQVQSMLKDERSEAMLKAFLNKWFEVDALRDMAEEDPIYEDMYNEIITYFSYIIKNDLNLQNLLKSDFTFLNDHMAEFYKIESDVGYVFRKRPLNSDQRGGIIGMAGFMALTSAGKETNPILRGNFILSTILGTPTPPPPPDAGILPAASETTNMSLREVLVEHRKNPSCRGCHALIDPLGFPLENYDHMGRWRDNVDNHAELANGKKITGPQELRRYLIKNRDHFYRKVSSVFLSYAMNRELNHYDFYLVNKCHTNLRNNDNRFSAIVATIILSDQFQYKL